MDPSEIERASKAYVTQVTSASSPLAIFYLDRWRKAELALNQTLTDLIFVDLASWNQEKRYSPLIEQVHTEGKRIYGSIPTEEQDRVSETKHTFTEHTPKSGDI